MPETTTKISTALIGAGLFSKDVYAKQLKDPNGPFKLKSVWSRTPENASAFVSEFGLDASTASGDAELNSLLQSEEIRLFILVLPVQISLQVAQRALAAGKHVIQEKPIAQDSAQAHAAFQEYSKDPKSLWLFAENYRFENVFLEACHLLDSIGKVLKFDLVADMPMDPRNKYYNSAWRRDVAGCPGGFLMDSSVHFLAALRLLALAAGYDDKFSKVTASAFHGREDLSPPDTLVGTVAYKDGPVASVSISLGAEQVRFSLTAVGSKGSIEVTRGGWTGQRAKYTLSVRKEGSEPVTKQLDFSGIGNELQEFANLIVAFEESSDKLSFFSAHHGAWTKRSWQDSACRSSPLEGAADLALMEALLSASET